MASTPQKRTAEAAATTSDPVKSKKPKNAEVSGTAPAKSNQMSQTDLQKSLLNSDKELVKVFLQFLREKPANIDRKQFVRDFWADRQHLLRAHAIERQQDRGKYNVLSEVRPQVREGSMKLDISQDQIQAMFRMYAVVRTAHSETIRNKDDKNDRRPFGSEVEFWQEFFRSRLCKKLRGQRIRDDDPRSRELDKYLDVSEDELKLRLGRQVAEQHVHHFIDLEGNEQHHSQRAGNAPDISMKQSDDRQMPIIRRLNATSEQIMADSEPADPGGSGNPHAPIGMDEETWKQLQLRDLKGDSGGNSVRLTIKESQGFQKREERKGGEKDQKMQKRTKADPKKIMEGLKKRKEGLEKDLLDLSISSAFPEDSESDESGSDDEGKKPKAKKGKAAANQTLRLASQQIHNLIRSQHDDPLLRANQSRQTGKSETENIIKAFGWPSDSYNAIEELLLTYATTKEFLHYFWSLTLVQAATMKIELPGLLESMSKSLARLKSLAEAAETARKGKLQELKKQAQQTAARTRAEPHVDAKKAGPSKKQIDSLVLPLRRSVEGAILKGQKLLKTS